VFDADRAIDAHVIPHDIPEHAASRLARRFLGRPRGPPLSKRSIEQCEQVVTVRNGGFREEVWRPDATRDVRQVSPRRYEHDGDRLLPGVVQSI
jgi:hypothetical protein